MTAGKAVYNCHQLIPDLILVDYNMPYLSGLEVVAELQKLMSKPKIVIIGIYAEKRELKLFSAFNVDGYISKTTPSAELISSLNKIVAGDKNSQCRIGA